MTHNQINYWNYVETGRHNVETEKENARHNLASESETNRHNVATEQIDLGKLNETIRHNKVTEGVSMSQLAEDVRHNLASESLGWGNLSETNRHNQVSEWIDKSDTLSQNQLRESQRALNQANVELAQIKTRWESLLRNADLHLSQAQRDKVEAEIAQIQQRVSLGVQGNAQDWLSSISDALGSVGRIISAVK